MNKKYIVLAALTAVVLSGCVDKKTHKARNVEYDYAQQEVFVLPECVQEEMITVQDQYGTIEVPSCSEFVGGVELPEPPANKFADAQHDTLLVSDAEEIAEKELNPDELEGEFPAVEDNKYGPKNQIVLQNLNTRTLAYCRGTEKEAETCAKRLESTCYVRLTNIPRFEAKYDILKRGNYPSRRWRGGEIVPRW